MQISIITINYNNKSGLEKTIHSVVGQNNKSYEYIIIDGNSSDGSIEIIKDNSQYISLWKIERDNGIYDAMNKGIKEASGEYLMFLNSGDCLSEKDTLSICIENVERNPEVDIFYGDIYGTRNDISKNWIHTHPPKLSLQFWRHCNINHQAALIKASLFKEYGLYPDKYRLAGDHWLFLKSFLDQKLFFHIPEPLVVYDYSGSSATGRSKYVDEMNDMWAQLVPKYISEVIEENEALSFFLNKKLIRVAKKADSGVQTFKRFFRTLTKHK